MNYRFRVLAPASVAAFLALLVLSVSTSSARAETTLLNVSYDVTREFYQDINREFAEHWRRTANETVTIRQSHGGSSKQARSVIDGLEADVITMNQALDIDMLAERGKLIPTNWADRLPHRSAPNTSTILFLVRQGNPKGIRDWPDLIRPKISVIIPNPKTSGNGRYSYLAAWAYALRQPGGDASKAEAFVASLFRNVPVLDSGGRGATTTFAQRGIGDVLLTFESEIEPIRREFGTNSFAVVVPPTSILAENPVTWVDKVVKKRKTEALARAYLEFLYSETGQELAARHHFRPRDPKILAKHRDGFPTLDLFDVDSVFGSWRQAQKIHFDDGGVFDRIYIR